jgi:hypothetical protein
MSRGNNRLGWGNGGNFLLPSALNDVYSYGAFWVPVGAFTPTEGFPWSLEEYTSSGGPTLHYTWTVANCDPVTKSGGTFTWAFKSDFMAATEVSLKLKVAPIFFGKVAGVAPNDVVKWSLGAVNLVMGDSINIVDNLETTLLSEVGTAYQVNGGDQTSKENVPLTLVNDSSGGAIGSDISATGWNFMTINVERETVDGAEDTYPEDIFLFGVGVQFACDFNNVAQWPTP